MLHKKAVFIALLTTLNLFFTASSFAEQLAKPQYQVVDKFSVNVPNRQITTSLDTVAIGGALGLQHNVSTFSSSFLANEGFFNTGFNDRFGGGARIEWVAKNTGPGFYDGSQPTTNNIIKNDLYVLRVSDGIDSEDFVFIGANTWVYNGLSQFVFTGLNTCTYTPIDKPTTSYSGVSCSYNAMRDARNVLLSTDKQMLWIKADGTEVIFNRLSANAAGGGLSKTSGYLSSIKYPNGFTIHIEHDTNYKDVVKSVTTNTGFQLIYTYLIDTATYNFTPKLLSANANLPTVEWSLKRELHT